LPLRDPERDRCRAHAGVGDDDLPGSGGETVPRRHGERDDEECYSGQISHCISLPVGRNIAAFNRANQIEISLEETQTENRMFSRKGAKTLSSELLSFDPFGELRVDSQRRRLRSLAFTRDDGLGPVPFAP
jgi:hypothetical protein